MKLLVKDLKQLVVEANSADDLSTVADEFEQLAREWAGIKAKRAALLARVEQLKATDPDMAKEIGALLQRVWAIPIHEQGLMTTAELCRRLGST